MRLNERQFGALSSRADQSPLLGRPEETCGRPPLPRARPFPGASPCFSEKCLRAMVAVPSPVSPRFRVHRLASVAGAHTHTPPHTPPASMAASPWEPASQAPGRLQQGCAVCHGPARASAHQRTCLWFRRAQPGRDFKSWLKW